MSQSPDYHNLKTTLQNPNNDKPDWSKLSSELGVTPPPALSKINDSTSFKLSHFEVFPAPTKAFLADLSFDSPDGSFVGVLVAWKEKLGDDNPQGDVNFFLSFQLFTDLTFEIPVIGSQWHIFIDAMLVRDQISAEDSDELYKMITGQRRDPVGVEATHTKYPTPPSKGIENNLTFLINLGPKGFNVPILEWKKIPNPHPKRTDKEKVEKKVGPFFIKRIHAEADTSSNKAGLSVDLGFQRDGFTLMFLGVGLDISLKDGSVTPTISGAEVAYQNPALVLGGGLYYAKADDNHPYPQFWGELQISVIHKFSLTALGGYTKDSQGDASFYGFVFLGGIELGAPPFVVNGIAGGFGFNRKLDLPPVSKLSTFPFIQAAMSMADETGDGGGSSSLFTNLDGKPKYDNPFPSDTSDPTSVSGCLKTMQTYLPVCEGEKWLAAGLAFSICEMVQGFALLTVSWGVDFTVSLMGAAVASLPPDRDANEDPAVFVELEMLVVFSPTQGVFEIQAQLAPASYILDKACHLVGSFALCSWFGPNPHANQFVLTLGGYHPSFDPPSYYPQQLKRLGLNWKISDDALIKGGAYYALTSSACMLGGYLEAVWAKGPAQAWFEVEADALFMWHPFKYDISAGIHLGVRVRVKVWFVHITLTLHLGVDLHIWGPKFSGSAHVDLSVVSFTIHLGANASQEAPAMTWPQFQQTFFSAANGSQKKGGKNICDIQATRGLIRKGVGEIDWVIDPEHLELRISSLIPAKSAEKLGKISSISGLGGFNTEYGVGPMKLGSDDFQSKLKISFSGTDSTLSALAIPGNAPAALWKEDAHQCPMGDGSTITNILTGFSLVPDQTPPDKTLPIDTELLHFTDGQPVLFGPLSPTVATSDGFADQTVAATIESAKARHNRAALLAALPAYLSVDKSVDLSALQQTDEFLAKPGLRLLGEEKA